VGINLHALWFNVRELYLQKIPEPLVLTFFSFFRGLKQEILGHDHFRRPIDDIRNCVDLSSDSQEMLKNVIVLKRVDDSKKKALYRSLRGGTFSYCFTCTTCSSACPVVRAGNDVSRRLGLLPHQIIRAINLGLTEMVFRTEMLWSCLVCYLCHDACPQGVRVADILTELKLMAISQVRDYLLKDKKSEGV